MTAPDPVQRLREVLEIREVTRSRDLEPTDARIDSAAKDLLDALPAMLQAEKIRTLEEAADYIDGVYPPDVFIPPAPERVAEIAAWIASTGGTLDALTAHMIRTAPRILRHLASVAASDELAHETREQGHQ